eukprot:761300-Hanusia_phi.AAC.3
MTADAGKGTDSPTWRWELGQGRGGRGGGGRDLSCVGRSLTLASDDAKCKDGDGSAEAGGGSRTPFGKDRHRGVWTGRGARIGACGQRIEDGKKKGRRKKRRTEKGVSLVAGADVHFQGAAVALLTSFLWEKKLGGLMCMATFLPQFLKRRSGQAPIDVSVSVASLPALFCHGPPPVVLLSLLFLLLLSYS